MIDLDSFSNCSRVVAIATNFVQNLGIWVQLAERHSKTDYNIAIPILKCLMAIFCLHPMQV